MKPDPGQFGEQFGISPQEEKAMETRAHEDNMKDKLERLFSGSEEALLGEKGGYKAAVEAEAMSRMRGFPGHMMGSDEDGEFVHHTSDGYTSKWYGGPYIDHIHPKYGALDATNVTDREGKLPESLSPQQLIDAHNEFVQNAKINYPEKYQ